MNKNEFMQVIDILKGNWRFMFQTQEEMLLWWTHLKDYSFFDAKGGATRYVLSESEEPKIKSIIDSIDAYKAAARRQTYESQKTIGCIHCRDTGLITWTAPTGVRLGRPCDKCNKGRANYPWEFMSKEEQDEWIEKEAKKGRSVPRPAEASKEFCMEYVYGVSKKLGV